LAFADYIAELTQIPGLEAPAAIKFIQRAWKEIRDVRTWSFLVQNKDLYAPQIVIAGTVTVTQFSPNIQFDAQAIAALNASPALPPIAAQSVGVGRQFRVGAVIGTVANPALNNSGAVYSLLTYDPVGGGATLDRPFAGNGGPLQQYMVYRCYFEPPVTDFLRYIAVTNYTSGYAIIRDALSVPQESLAIFDPQRQSTGDAYSLSPFMTDYQNPNNPGGTIAHEFYPHPTNAAVYTGLFRRRGTDLSPTQDLPNTFPDSVLMARAFVHAADWALSNVPNKPELQGTNWVLFREGKEKMYRENLILAIKQDDEIFVKPSLRVGKYYATFPPGGQWLQSHALPLSTMQG
jgi:hypothetical protein